MKKLLLIAGAMMVLVCALQAQPTQKPPLHGKNWMAITGKPLAAAAGSMVFQQGGNAVDAAVAVSFALSVVLFFFFILL